MTAPAETQWLNTKQVIEEWGIARSALTRWYNEGKLDRRRENNQWVYPRDGVAKAFYTSWYRIPTGQTLMEEAEFFLGFGRSLDTVVADLAVSYNVAVETIRVRLEDHYPDLRGRIVRPALR